MSKNHIFNDNFIYSVFKPNVVVSSSTDADLLCVKNHLTFTDLLKPFSAINKDVILRDSNNISHCIKNLQINFEDISNCSLHPQQIKKLQNDIVSRCLTPFPSNNIIINHGSTEIHVPISTPWFEAWRQIFVQNMSFSEHEFLSHYLACLFVVSTFNNDTIDQFQRLSQQLNNFQHSDNFGSRCFNSNILKYYVLLHDQGQGDQSRAEELFKLVKSTFGNNNCYLLSINSVTTNTLSNDNLTNYCNEIETQTDPWIQYLIPGGHVLSEMVNISEDTSSVHQKHCESSEEHNSIITHDDPLLFIKSNLDEKELPIMFKYTFKSGVKCSTSFPQLNLNGNINFNLLNNEGLVTHDLLEITKVRSDVNKPHGECLSPSDHERIRQFVFEFVSFGLIPWVETTLKHLSDQIAYKLKMTRSFFNVTKKFFGGNTTHVKTNILSASSNLSSNLSGSASNINTTGSTRVVYTSEAVEMQMRRHADLAFLFQQYEVAYQTYNVLKKDFQDDAAWLHCAGAMEMSAISIFLQGNTSQRQYPYHYMDSAINIYMSHCRNIEYATRAALLNCEALKSQGLYLQASSQFIKLTTEENDLRSALLLEQSAHFYLQSKVPMLRKYAFHMILAGHRFSKAGQKKHTIRCYSQALPVFKGKGWILAEDHIYATISRHGYYQKQIEIALDALRQLLSKNSRQPPYLQANHLRDYLKIFKEYMETIIGPERELINGTLPEFVIPSLDSQSVKVILGHSIKSYEEVSVQAKDIEISDTNYTDTDWKELELSILESISSNNSNTSVPSKYSYIEKSNDVANLTVSIIGEPITVQMYLENPLHIPIILTDIHLLWQFTPDCSEYSSSFSTQSMKYNFRNCSLITNEIDHEYISEAHEFIGTEVHSDLCLLSKERKQIELSVFPKVLGFLKIIGLSFYLNSGTHNQNNNYFNQASEYYLDNDFSELPQIKLKGKIVFEVFRSVKNSDKLNENKLELIITPQMPKLKVAFSDFPKTMIIDEVSRFNVTLTNIGKEAMKNVVLAVKPHDYLTFGFDEFCHSITNHIYQYVTDKIDLNSDILSEEMRNICMGNCRTFNLGNDNKLLPGNSITIPIWIRFHHMLCVRKCLKFLFYYESVSTHPHLRYRLLRHKSEIDLRSNMRFQGQFIRPKGTDNQNFFINMKIENQHYLAENKVTEFEIYQITSISKKWHFDEEFCKRNVKGMIKIGPKETHSICFKLKPIDFKIHKVEKDKQYFSDLNFNADNSQFVRSSGSPCSDFFYLQYFQNRFSSDHNFNAGKSRESKDFFLSLWDDVCIIIFWKAVVYHSNDHKVYHEGQSHIFASGIDFSSISGDNNLIKNNHAKSLFDSNKRLISSDFNLQPLLQYSKIVNIYQKFQQFIRHDFQLKKKLIVPVSVMLYNKCKENIIVRLEPIDPPESFSDKVVTDNSIVTIKGNTNPEILKISKHSDIISNVLWVGLSSRQFQMKADSSIIIDLKCIVTNPGVYEIHSLTVKAAIDKKTAIVKKNDFALDLDNENNDHISLELPFIRQENTYSSILIVTQDPITS